MLCSAALPTTTPSLFHYSPPPLIPFLPKLTFRTQPIRHRYTKPLHFCKPSSSDPIEPESEPESELDGFEITVSKIEKNNNGRKIESRIRVDADLETIWSILTDYEGLADFIPSLAVSRLIEKREKYARLYQVGRQSLGLGLKFDAKGVIECYERDLEVVGNGRRKKREIGFEMVEGDFKMFVGKWCIEQQIDDEVCEDEELLTGQGFHTVLSYVVELEPKLWVPVRLLEGRLCREVKNNLLCVREEAQRVQRLRTEPFSTAWDTGAA